MHLNYQTKRVLTMISISLFIVSAVFTFFVGQLYFFDIDRSAQASDFIVRDNVIKSERALDELVEIKIRPEDEHTLLLNQLIALEENQSVISLQSETKDIQVTARAVQDVIVNNSELQVTDVLAGNMVIIEQIGIVHMLGTKSPSKNIDFEECYFAESKAYTSQLLQNSFVTLKFDKNFGHVSPDGIVYAYIFDENKSLINSEIIKEGYAKSSELQHLLTKPFVESEMMAINYSLGLWSPTSCGGGSFKQINGGLPTLTEATNEAASAATLTIIDTTQE